MIKTYDPNINGTHTIRITFMQWDFAGHISIERSGNCHGAILFEDALSGFDSSDILRFAENDCKFSYDDNYNYYSLVLKNKNGDELHNEGDIDEIKNMIVKIEITKVEKEAKQ